MLKITPLTWCCSQKFSLTNNLKPEDRNWIYNIFHDKWQLINCWLIFWTVSILVIKLTIISLSLFQHGGVSTLTRKLQSSALRSVIYPPKTRNQWLSLFKEFILKELSFCVYIHLPALRIWTGKLSRSAFFELAAYSQSERRTVRTWCLHSTFKLNCIYLHSLVGLQ